MAVTVEQLRAMHELGIKKRHDGKFGFKLLCGRPGCPELLEDECFCADTVEAAIRVKREGRRASATCSTECWLEWDSAWADVFDDIEDWLHSDKGEVVALRAELLPLVLLRTYDSDTPDAEPLDEPRPLTTDEVARYERLVFARGKRTEDDDLFIEGVEWRQGWIKHLRQANPALLRRLKEWRHKNADYDYEPPDGGDGVENCDCEVA